MRKIFKYPTGGEIPEGAEYLSTQVETRTTVFSEPFGDKVREDRIKENKLVWHYFLVEVK